MEENVAGLGLERHQATMRVRVHSYRRRCPLPRGLYRIQCLPSLPLMEETLNWPGAPAMEALAEKLQKRLEGRHTQETSTFSFFRLAGDDETLGQS